MRKIELRLVRESSSTGFSTSLKAQDLTQEHEDTQKVSCAKDAYAFFKFMENLPQEEVYAIYLTPKNKVIGISQVFKGSTDLCFFTPADIVRPALLTGATNIIIAHNHPSGDYEPSKNDEQSTNNLKQACDIIGLRLCDHLIIGDNKYYSFEENGQL